MDTTSFIKDSLISRGADLVGIGDLSELNADARSGLPVGICVAVKYPKDVIRGITELPTADYWQWYKKLNEKLDEIVTLGAKDLQSLGYSAIAQTRERVGDGGEKFRTPLPHKTVATRSGIGWIGKSALLVTERFGSMIRLSSILTNAPLETDAPVSQSKCGGCMICTKACPGEAVSGKLWEFGMERGEFFDAVKCRKTIQERSWLGFGAYATICGRCIALCPYTQRYLNEKE